jgi:hypothetical protein
MLYNQERIASELFTNHFPAFRFYRQKDDTTIIGAK